MPLARMSREVGNLIGHGLGKVLDVKVDGNVVCWCQFLLLKVEIDITLPLTQGRFLSIEGTQIWLPFKYERLPLSCFQCGVIKHAKRGCSLAGKRMDSSKERNPQYGLWVRATPSKFGGDTSKKYGGDGD